MRIILALSLIFALCLPLWAALTPEQVADYTAKLQGADEKLYTEAAVRLASDKQVDILLKALKSEKVAVRKAVVFAAQSCLNTAMLDALLGTLKDDADPLVRNSTISILVPAYALPAFKDRQPAILAALKAAVNDADNFVARDAVFGVAAITPQDVDFFLDLLANSRLGMVRGQAARVLAELKDPRIYDALVKAVADRTIEGSSRAITGLGRLGDKRAAPVLLAVLQDPKRNRTLVDNAAQALAALAAPEVLDALLKLAQTGAPPMREKALIALEGYTDPNATSTMLSMLADPAVKDLSLPTRAEVLRVLAERAEPRARELFIAVLAEKDRALRAAGIQGLLALDDDRAFDPVQTMLQSTSLIEMGTGLGLLGNSGNPRAIEPLLQFLQRRHEQQPDTKAGTGNDAVRKLTGGDSLSMTVPSGMNRTAPVSIGIKRTDGKPLVGGEVSDVLVTLYNRSKCAVVVQELIPTYHRGEDPIVLSGPVSGEVAARDPGGYVYDSTPQTMSRIPLHAGLLLPGQAMQVRTQYRPVSVNECILVRFVQAAQPYDGTPASLAPLTVLIPDAVRDAAVRNFVPFTDDGWRAVCKSMPVAVPTGPGAAERAVIVTRAAELTPATAPMMTYPAITFDFPIIDEFRTQAVVIAKRPMNELALGFSNALCAYVVAEGDRRWMMTGNKQTERGKALPTFPLPLLKDADCGSIRVQIDPKQPAAKPEGQKFWDVYPVEGGDGRYTNGLFITVDAAALPAFLDAVLAHHGALEMHEYFFRSRYYVLKL